MAIIHNLLYILPFISLIKIFVMILKKSIPLLQILNAILCAWMNKYFISIVLQCHLEYIRVSSVNVFDLNASIVVQASLVHQILSIEVNRISNEIKIFWNFGVTSKRSTTCKNACASTFAEWNYSDKSILLVILLIENLRH